MVTKAEILPELSPTSHLREISLQPYSDWFNFSYISFAETIPTADYVKLWQRGGYLCSEVVSREGLSDMRPISPKPNSCCAINEEGNRSCKKMKTVYYTRCFELSRWNQLMISQNSGVSLNFLLYSLFFFPLWDSLGGKNKSVVNLWFN